MSRQVGDLAHKIGVQAFQFLDAGAEQSGFGWCSHGATVAAGFAGVDQEIYGSGQSSYDLRGLQVTFRSPPP